jgi:hypothetical protein
VTTRTPGASSCAVKSRPDAEHAEEGPGNVLDRQLRGVAGAGERRTERHRHRRQFLEGLIQLAPVDEVAGRDDVVLLVTREVVLPHDGDLVGVRIRQRPQQECIDDAEDGSVRADAERQGGHGHEGESGGPQQQPGRIAEVLQKVAHYSLLEPLSHES